MGLLQEESFLAAVTASSIPLVSRLIATEEYYYDAYDAINIVKMSQYPI